MRLYMIRHGETKGNREQRYVGTTDEGLLPESFTRLKNRKMPEVDKLYISPMKRCVETAGLLYPYCEPVVVEEFRECDFGEFEYRNYAELNGNPAYQHFIDTMGAEGFPGGESLQEFQERCLRGMERILGEITDGESLREEQNIGLVIHGGTIMSLLDKYSYPHRDYYEWQTGNGSGYAAELIKDSDTGEIHFSNIVKL